MLNMKMNTFLLSSAAYYTFKCLLVLKCRSIMVHNRLLQSGSSQRWNDLPKAVKCAASLTLFKKHVKNLLYQLVIISPQNILSMYMFCMYVHVCIHCPI